MRVQTACFQAFQRRAATAREDACAVAARVTCVRRPHAFYDCLAVTLKLEMVE